VSDLAEINVFLLVFKHIKLLGLLQREE